MRRKVLLIGLVVMILLSTIGCSNNDEEPTVYINVICESEDVSELFYSVYLGSKRCDIGDLAKRDKSVIGREDQLTLHLKRSELFKKEDLSNLAINLTPYDQSGKYDFGETEALAIPAEYGNTYTVVLSGNTASGYKLRLE